MTDRDTDRPGVALADPPAPPSGPPKAPSATGEAPRPGRLGIGAIVAIVIVALVLLGLVVWLVVSARRQAPVDANATRTAFESAMRKAGVKADYPPGPIDLKAVRATGSHSFENTFTPDEIAALVNTFRHTAEVRATTISLRNVRLEFPQTDRVRARASVTANGGTYSGDATLDISFELGRFRTTGVSELSVEGINASPEQRALVADGLVNYANDYLANAPGLTLITAKVEKDGVRASGMAPDGLSYQP